MIKFLANHIHNHINVQGSTPAVLFLKHLL